MDAFVIDEYFIFHTAATQKDEREDSDSVVSFREDAQ